MAEERKWYNTLMPVIDIIKRFFSVGDTSAEAEWKPVGKPAGKPAGTGPAEPL